MRSAGSDPKAVAEVVAQAVDGYEAGGVASSAKHFPGHGRLTVDSHESLPVSQKSIDELESTDLLPFKSAVEAEFGMPASELSLVCGTAVLQDDHVIDELISRDILDPSAILHVVSKGGQRAAGEIASVLVQQPAAARLAGLELEDGAALPARPRVAFFEPRVALHDNPVETPIEVYVEDRRA